MADFLSRKWTRQPQGRVLVRGDPVLAGSQIMLGGYEYDYRTGARQISNVGTNARLAVRGEIAARHLGTGAGNYTSLGTPTLPVVNCYAWVVRFFVDSIGVTTVFMSSDHADSGADSYALVMRVINSGNLQLVNKASSVEFSAGNGTIRANTWHTLAVRGGDYPAEIANNNRKSLWLDGRLLYLDTSTANTIVNAQGEFAVACATHSGGTDGNNCGVSLSILLPNSASDADLKELSRDPWQVFSSRKSFLYSSAGSGAQTLTPGLFTNSQSFYAPTVTPGAVALTPALFSNTQTFYSPTVALGGATQDLTPARFDNAQTFYAPTVTPGAVTLTPELFVNSNNFFVAQVSTDAVPDPNPIFWGGWAHPRLRQRDDETEAVAEVIETVLDAPPATSMRSAMQDALLDARVKGKLDGLIEDLAARAGREQSRRNAQADEDMQIVKILAALL